MMMTMSLIICWLPTTNQDSRPVKVH